MISIIIVNYHTERLIKYNLRRIAVSVLTRPWEVIVVDNSAATGNAETLRSALEALGARGRYIPAPKNLGFAGGCNLGVRSSEGSMLLFLNPDVVLGSTTLEDLARFLDTHEDVAALTPRLLNPDGSQQESFYRFPAWYIPILRRTVFGRLAPARRALDRYLMKEIALNGPCEIDWAIGACILVRRSAFERIGPFDERFFMYFEDTDWCRRLREGGEKIVLVPEITCVHYHRRQSAHFSSLFSMRNRAGRAHVASAIKYFWKYR